MNILDFLNKYKSEIEQITLKSDWNSLKNQLKGDESSLNLLMENLVEERFPFELIKDLYNFGSTEKFNKHPDLFKWAVAFHGSKAIRFFYDNLNIKDEEGAINAAIINFRLDNLKCLSELGINVFNEKQFCQAIQRSYQSKSSCIVNYYISNLDKFQITHYSTNLLNENENLILWAIKEGNIDTVSYLIKIKKNVIIDRGTLLISACVDGRMDSIKYFLDDKNFTSLSHVTKIKNNDIVKAYEQACINGHSNIVRNFLENFKKNVNPTTKDSIAFTYSCNRGDLSLIKYVLTSPKFKKHADIHAKDDSGLYWACMNGHLHVVKYLVSSPELKEHANLHAQDDRAFLTAMNHGHQEILEYLIFERDIEKTESIISAIKDSEHSDIENLFKMREFSNKLKEELPSKNSKASSRPKV